MIKVQQDCKIFNVDIPELWDELRQLKVVREEIPEGIIGQLALAARVKNAIEAEIQNNLEVAFEASDIVDELIGWLLLDLSGTEIEISTVVEEE